MYAETMDYVFTQEQLDSMAAEERVGRAVRNLNTDRLKTHHLDGTKA